MAERKQYVSPVNGQPLPRGKPFTSETGKKARSIRTAKQMADASIAKEFKRLVAEMQTDKNGKQILGAELIAKAIMRSCLNGNVKAQELALALMGEKPVEKIMVAAIEANVIDEVERAVLHGTSTGN